MVGRDSEQAGIIRKAAASWSNAIANSVVPKISVQSLAARMARAVITHSAARPSTRYFLLAWPDAAGRAYAVMGGEQAASTLLDITISCPGNAQATSRKPKRWRSFSRRKVEASYHEQMDVRRVPPPACGWTRQDHRAGA